METKNVGWLIIGLSLIIILIIILFNTTLKEIVSASCTGEHGNVCPMYKAIDRETYLAFSIVGVLVLIGLVLIFTKPKERLIVKTIKEKKHVKKVDLSGLKEEETAVYNLINTSGTIFQADIIEKLGLGKAKVSRIIDRLEGRGLVERKRRGMTNVVVKKEA